MLVKKKKETNYYGVRKREGAETNASPSPIKCSIYRHNKEREMASGEETLKSESRDSAVSLSSTLKEDEPCETSSRRKSKPEGKKAPLFTQKNEIILLKELVKFREKFGDVNRWKEFHKMSELQNQYSDKQIAEKMRRMRDKYESTREPPPPDADHRQLRIFELSKLLWGTAPPKQQTTAAAQTRRGTKRKTSAAAAAALPNPGDFPRLSEFFGDREVPEILRSHWVLMGSEAATQFERQWRNLYVKEVSLLHDKLVLKKELCLTLSEIIRRQSSSPALENNIKEKGTYSNNDAELSSDNSKDLVDEEECDHESKEKDCEQESENNLPSLDGVEIERGVVDGDYGSSKKKTSKKKKGLTKGKQVYVMNTLPPSNVEIEDLAEGDPNGKLASRGMKVKVHFTAKLKDTEDVFESTFNKRPRIICLGDEAMIDGFSFGVEGMRVGGKRRIIIPPSLGFGEEGFEDIIPPNSWLEYEVELIDLRN